MSRAARRAAARRPLPPLTPDPLGARAAAAAARERQDAETLRQRTQQLLDLSPEARQAFAAMGFVTHTSSGFPVPGPLEPAPLVPAPIEPDPTVAALHLNRRCGTCAMAEPELLADGCPLPADQAGSCGVTWATP